MRDAGVRDLGRRLASLLLVERQSAMYRIQGFVYISRAETPQYNKWEQVRGGASLVADSTVVAAVCHTVQILHTKNLNTVSSNLLLVLKVMMCSYGRMGVCLQYGERHQKSWTARPSRQDL